MFIITKDLKTFIFNNKRDYSITYVFVSYIYNISLLKRYKVLRAGF